LMQVPRIWMYDLTFEHVRVLMEGYEKAMEGINEMNGYLPTSVMNKHTLYLQPDLQIRRVAYGVGYPQINQLLNCNEQGPMADGVPGASSHWLVNDPVEWSVTYHEAGHCQLQSMYRGETEASNNLFHAYVRNVKFNTSFDVGEARLLQE
jgi:hypothetical protein